MVGLGDEFLLIHCCNALYSEASQTALKTHTAPLKYSNFWGEDHIPPKIGLIARTTYVREISTDHKTAAAAIEGKLDPGDYLPLYQSLASAMAVPLSFFSC